MAGIPSIPTRWHGLADYIAATALLSLPWLLQKESRTIITADTLVPVAAGVTLLGISLTTDYEWGALDKIDMPSHLAMDAGLGLVLAAGAAPLIQNRRLRTACIVIGLTHTLRALLTEVRTGREKAVSQGADTGFELPPGSAEYVAEQISRHG